MAGEHQSGLPPLTPQTVGPGSTAVQGEDGCNGCGEVHVGYAHGHFCVTCVRTIMQDDVGEALWWNDLARRMKAASEHLRRTAVLDVTAQKAEDIELATIAVVFQAERLRR